jgi:hypothetical protein
MAVCIHFFIWSIIFFVLASVVTAIGVLAIVSELDRPMSRVVDLLVSIVMSVAIPGGFAFLLAAIGCGLLKSRRAMLRGQFRALRSKPTDFDIVAVLFGIATLALSAWLFEGIRAGVLWLVAAGAVMCLMGVVGAVWTKLSFEQALAELRTRDESMRV